MPWNFTIAHQSTRLVFQMFLSIRNVSRRLSSWTPADLFIQMQQLNKSKRFREAIDLFEQMTTTPNACTLFTFFKICTALADDRWLQLAKNVILHSYR